MKRNDLVKRELSNTLKALIREKPLESVTVSEISSACGVSRARSTIISSTSMT